MIKICKHKRYGKLVAAHSNCTHELARHCDEWALCVHDWSRLNYHRLEVNKTVIR